MKTDKIKAGDVLYDVHSHAAGNTTMRVQGVWKVRVLDERTVEVPNAPSIRQLLVSWNGNAAEWLCAWECGRYRRVPPEWLRMRVMMGRSCYVCGGREIDGHRDDCAHPRAVSARKRVTK